MNFVEDTKNTWRNTQKIIVVNSEHKLFLKQDFVEEIIFCYPQSSCFFFKKRFANVTKSSYSLYYETVCYKNMLMKKMGFLQI